MAKAEESDALIAGATLPGTPVSPRKASCLDHPHRKLVLKSCFDLFSQPSEISQFLHYGCLWILPNHNTRKVWDVGPQCVNMPVALNHNLNVECEQPFQTDEPFVAIHVGVGSCEVAAHEGIAGEQQFFTSIV
jgi:hypothetical protein